MRLLISLVGLFLLGPVSAATTITFEDVSTGPMLVGTESGGFSFYQTFGVGAWIENNEPNGNHIRVTTYEDTNLIMESASGDNFALNSFYSLGTIPLTVTGFYAGGGTIQTIVDTELAGTTFLDASWQNLEKVEFFMPGLPFGVLLDDIVVTAVPVPAAVWLFGSALVGLGWLRRRPSC